MNVFKLLRLHQKRSIHVHVWNQETFSALPRQSYYKFKPKLFSRRYGEQCR